MSYQLNQLSQSTSPYLLQHADNPVHWWPWCDEALKVAREQNKPILLSIGYSACHWCHVMAHESFEDVATAKVMNELFINIKVDREERPDLDKIYQSAHQLLSQRAGGWPLTVFLMPDDHLPFFAGTYFPNKPRHGLPSFIDLMQQIHTAYRQQGDAIKTQNQSLQKAMARLSSSASTDQLDDSPIKTAILQLRQHYDERNGGIGSAPKFPHPNTLEFLLRHAHQHADEQTKHMVLFTLEKMALGGMNDLIGGGFCRYSVDDYWMIPHFEKMLYDNGPLLALYADAWQSDQHRPLFKHSCQATAEWVLREMQAEDGGYFSSLDADSEGEEGKFYAWTREEVAEQLTDLEYDLFAQHFGLDQKANFEGKWNPHTSIDTQNLAKTNKLLLSEVEKHLESARVKLFKAREMRIRPERDEKILTSWNALMIKGMARAGRIFDQSKWIDSAEKALDYLYSRHWVDGRLLATSKDGKAHLNAYLDDYAYLIDALLELLQCRWRNQDLNFACELADVLLNHFEDKTNGGFYFTADDHEQLIQRIKPLSDDAIPSGNGIAAYALNRLGFLLGETRYIDAAERALKASWGAISHMPYAHPGLLIALQESLDLPETLVIRADPDSLHEWHSHAHNKYHPWRQVFAISSHTENLSASLSQKNFPGKNIAYRCQGLRCDPPILQIDALKME